MVATDNIYWTNVIIEFIGTFVFLSVIMNAAMKGHGGFLTPIAIGLGLVAAIYMFNNEHSVNHYNPAVTFMSWCRGDTTNMVLGSFIGAQLAGAFAAYAVHKYAVAY